MRVNKCLIKFRGRIEIAVYFTSIRKINKNVELCWDYGPNYWKDHSKMKN